MAISDLVDYIQATYRPTGQLPEASDLQLNRDVDAESERQQDVRWPVNLPAIDRPRLPDWVGEGDELEPEVIPALDDEPVAQPGPPPAGPDTLAYYLPFHFYRDRWGIYIRPSGVKAVAAMLSASVGRPPAEFSEIATEILLRHERFHFVTEVACARAEVASRSPLYRSYFSDRRAAALEEALANADAFRFAVATKLAAIQEAVRTWMRSQGPGYDDFERWVRRGAFSKGRQLATGAMISHVRGSGSLGPTRFLYDGLSKSHAPILWLHETAAAGMLRPFPKFMGIRILVHTNDHPPPHVHFQATDGSAATRLQWPSLEPVKGDPSLSAADKKRLGSYLAKYGRQIGAEVERIYRLVSDQVVRTDATIRALRRPIER